MEVISRLNQKTKFTRMCISEAIVALLKNTDFGRLKISDIVKKAGVARASFYKYYDSPYAALTDYLQIIIAEYVDANKAHAKSKFLEYEHILFSLQFFDKYVNYFLTLAKCKLHGIMLDGINRFMAENVQTGRKMTIYELYSYAGGLLNSFLKWEESGKKESAEDVAMAIYNMYSPENHSLE